MPVPGVPAGAAQAAPMTPASAPGLPAVRFLPTVNESSRHGAAVELVIVHTPEGSYEGTIGYLRRPGVPASYHLLVREDGLEATQLVRWSRKAWHAVVFNAISDGIALAGFKAAYDRGLHRGAFKAGARVVAARLRARGLPARWARGGRGRGFCRHADLGPRGTGGAVRTDPMGLARWLRFVALVKLEHRRLRRA